MNYNAEFLNQTQITRKLKTNSNKMHDKYPPPYLKNALPSKCENESKDNNMEKGKSVAH